MIFFHTYYLLQSKYHYVKPTQSAIKKSENNKMQKLVNGYVLESDLTSATHIASNVEITFTSMETSALELLISGEVIPKVAIEQAAWKGAAVTENSVRKLMSDIRKKFNCTNCVKNYRGKGYKLITNEDGNNAKEGACVAKRFFNTTKAKVISAVCTVFILITGLYTYLHLVADKETSTRLAEFNKSIIRSTDNLLNYTFYKNNYYIATFDNDSSKIIKKKNLQETVFEIKGKSIHNFSISKEGKSTIQLVSPSECQLNVYKDIFQSIEATIPCLPKNNLIHTQWTSPTSFYFTYMPSEDLSARIHAYDVVTKEITQIKNSGINYVNNDGYGDYFFEEFNNGFLSLRINSEDNAVLHYSDNIMNAALYTFNNKPFTFALDNNNVIFTSPSGTLMQINLDINNLEQEYKAAPKSAPSAFKAYYPKFVNKELHYYVGEGLRAVIKSSPEGDVYFNPTFSVIDLEEGNNGLNVLSSTNSGYEVSKINTSKEITTQTIKTTINLTSADARKEHWVVGGPTGLFVFENNELTKIFDDAIHNIIITEKCAMFETNSAIYTLKQDNSISILNPTGQRLKNKGQSCIYENKISKEIFDEEGTLIAKNTNNDNFFSINNTIAKGSSDGYNSEYRDIYTQEVVLKINDRKLNGKITSSNGVVFYLSRDKSYNQLISVN